METSSLCMNYNTLCELIKLVIVVRWMTKLQIASWECQDDYNRVPSIQ